MVSDDSEDDVMMADEQNIKIKHHPNRLLRQ